MIFKHRYLLFLLPLILFIQAAIPLQVLFMGGGEDVPKIHTDIDADSVQFSLSSVHLNIVKLDDHIIYYQILEKGRGKK